MTLLGPEIHVRSGFRVYDGPVPAPRSKPRQARFGPVTAITPDPAVWAEALRLAGGDVRRCRVVSATTVIVLNFRGQKLPARPPQVRKLALTIGELTGAPEYTAWAHAEHVWATTAGHRPAGTR